MMHWDHGVVEHCGGTSGLVALSRVARLQSGQVQSNDNCGERES